MATFYVLPPRECLEQLLNEFCGRILPGLPVPDSLCEDLLAALLPAAPCGNDFVVHREDLPGTGDLAADLAEGFGAEPGDEVIEFGLATAGVPARVRRSVVPAAVSETAVLR